MSISLIVLVASLYLGGIAGTILLIIAAFRVSVGWGLGVLCIPFGSFAFRFAHADEVGPSFKISRICYVLCAVLISANPETFGGLKSRLATISDFRQHRSSTPVSHEARPPGPEEDSEDQDDSSDASASTLAMRENLPVLQETYRQHVAELNAIYERLRIERAALKGPGPATTAFNAKAAEYQASIRKLAEEKTHLDSLAQASKLAGGGGSDYTKSVADSLPGSRSASTGTH